MSILHATYLYCIKPYINKYCNALEIGSGRGAWTKCLLPFREVHVLEVLQPEETHIYDYLGGKPDNLFYHVINDFSCKNLPDDDYGYFGYMFSFGTFCHLPFWAIEEYAKNLFPKIRTEADCFWMISDYKKAGLQPDKDEEERPGRWYDNNLDRTCEMLRKIGYKIISEDVGTNLRDPIIHFYKDW